MLKLLQFKIPNFIYNFGIQVRQFKTEAISNKYLVKNLSLISVQNLDCLVLKIRVSLVQFQFEPPTKKSLTSL